MASLKKNPEDSLDKILKKFKKKLKEEGFVEELRKREYYEKPSEVKKKKMRAAIRRNKKRLKKNK